MVSEAIVHSSYIKGHTLIRQPQQVDIGFTTEQKKRLHTMKGQIVTAFFLSVVFCCSGDKARVLNQEDKLRYNGKALRICLYAFYLS